MLRETRPKRAAPAEAKTTTTAPAKTSSKASSRTGAMLRQPEHEQRHGEAHVGGRQQLERALLRAVEKLVSHRLARAVAQLERPGDGGDPAARMADRRRQRPLRVAGERRVSGREERDPADRSRAGEVAGQKREGAPGEGEAEVVVDRAAEELEVVGRDERRLRRRRRPAARGRTRPRRRSRSRRRLRARRPSARAARGPGSALRAGGRSARRARARRSPLRGRTPPPRPRGALRGARAQVPPRSRRSSGARPCRAGASRVT